MLKLKFGLLLLLSVIKITWGYTICPDGNYYPNGTCQINPDGTWRTSSSSTLAPNGQYVPNYSSNSQGQNILDASRLADPYGAFRQGAMAKEKYDLEEKELELRRLELEKKLKEMRNQ